MINTSQPALGGAPEPGGGSEQPRALPFGSQIRYFGDYLLLGEIASGGMGVVYRARQVSLNRKVAIKMIRSGDLAGAAERERFRREAEAVAALDHPRIVPIYEVGERAAHLFFSMKLLTGGSLAEALAEPDWDFSSAGQRRAAELVAKIAEAVQHAHQRGVLHRDLKPSNILLDEAEEPHVSDFGLARLDAPGSDTATQTGARLGTPAYMAPEQAAGRTKDITVATDVYGLGAVLYELLTGRAPFTEPDVLKQVQEREVLPPSRLRAGIHADLETICFKCLEKEPARRYASALALAEDLQRWLKGEPILARPVTSVERVVKWARRRPAIAALAGGVTLLSVIAVIVLMVEEWRLAEAYRELQGAYGKALLQQIQESLLRTNHTEALQLAVQLQRRAPHYRAGSLSLAAILTQTSWPLPVEIASSSVPNALAGVRSEARLPALDRAQGTLAAGRETRLNAEGAKLSRLGDDALRMGTATAYAVSRDYDAFAYAIPDHRLMVVGWKGDRPYAFDWPGTPANELCFSPDGGLLAVIASNRVQVIALPSGRKVAEWNHPEAVVTQVIFFPDQARLVSVAGQVWLCDLGSNRPPVALANGPKATVRCAVNPDGRMLATATAKGLIQIWDLEAPTPAVVTVTTNEQTCLSFSPDGRYLAVTGRQGTCLFDVRQRQLLLSPFERSGLEAQFHCFSPESGRLLLLGLQEADIWDLVADAPACERFQGTGQLLLNGAFTGNGQAALLADKQAGHRAYDVRPGRAFPLRLRGQPELKSAAFDPTGQRVAAGTAAGTFAIWETRRGTQVLAGKLPTPAPIERIRFSPDGGRLVVASAGGVVQCLDAATGAGLGAAMRHSNAVTDVQFDAEGRRLVTASEDGTAAVWDAATGRELAPRLQHPHNGLGSRVGSAFFSADGREIITASWNAEVRYWEATSGRLLSVLTNGAGAPFYQAGVTPDGVKMALLQLDAAVPILDVRSRTWLAQPIRPGYLPTKGVMISPDGKTLLVAGEPVLTLWDADSGRRIAQLAAGSATLTTAAFDTAGERLVTGFADGTVRVWDAGSGFLIAPELRHSTQIARAEFSPDSQRLLVACASGELFLYDLPAPPGSPPGWLPDVVRLVTGKDQSPDGRERLLTVKECENLRARLEAIPPAGAWEKWLKWFLADRSTRLIGPGSELSVPDYVQQCIAEGSLASLRVAVAFSPTNRIARLRLAEKAGTQDR